MKQLMESKMKKFIIKLLFSRRQRSSEFGSALGLTKRSNIVRPFPAAAQPARKPVSPQPKPEPRNSVSESNRGRRKAAEPVDDIDDEDDDDYYDDDEEEDDKKGGFLFCLFKKHKNFDDDDFDDEDDDDFDD